MGLIEFEQPGRRAAPQFGVVERIEPLEVVQQPDSRGRGAGERSERPEALFAIVVGGVEIFPVTSPDKAALTVAAIWAVTTP